jgi:hypothetical protein
MEFLHGGKLRREHAAHSHYRVSGVLRRKTVQTPLPGH